MTVEPAASGQVMSAFRGAERDILDALLRSAGHGDLPAFGELYDLTVARIFGLSRSILRNHSLAEEVTQDVYFEIWRRAARFDSNKGPAISWMLTLTHSRAVDKVRRAQVLRNYDDTYGMSTFAPDIDTVIEQVIRTENDRQIHAALAQLTAVQRQAIYLTYFLGHTNTESSRLLKIPLPTFKARLRAAQIALRTMNSSSESARARDSETRDSPRRGTRGPTDGSGPAPHPRGCRRIRWVPRRGQRVSFRKGDRVAATDSLGGTHFPAVSRGAEGVVTAESVWGGSYTVEFDNGHTETGVAEWYLKSI